MPADENSPGTLWRRRIVERNGGGREKGLYCERPVRQTEEGGLGEADHASA